VTVWKMRKHQKAYFTQGGKQSDLVDAKRYEKLVDDELVRRLVFTNDVPTGLSAGEATDEPTQANIFDGDGQ